MSGFRFLNFRVVFEKDGLAGLASPSCHSTLTLKMWSGLGTRLCYGRGWIEGSGALKPTSLDNVLFLLLLVCSDHHQQQQQHHPHPQKGAAAGGSSNGSTSEASPGRPRSMVGLDVHVNAAAMEAPSMMASGENWRERSSSDGKILKKTASWVFFSLSLSPPGHD